MVGACHCSTFTGGFSDKKRANVSASDTTTRTTFISTSSSERRPRRHALMHQPSPTPRHQPSDAILMPATHVRTVADCAVAHLDVHARTCVSLALNKVWLFRLLRVWSRITNVRVNYWVESTATLNELSLTSTIANHTASWMNAEYIDLAYPF